MTQAPVARGSPHTHAGLASRATAKLQPPVPGVGSRALCAGLGGRRRCPGQQPPAPRTPSPRASEVQPRGRVGTGVLRYTRPCRAAGKALLSPVEIKHRMGMGREGVWQQPAAGSGRGLGRGGSSCARPGVLHVQLLPLTRAYIQRRRESGVPRPAAARPLWSPC